MYAPGFAGSGSHVGAAAASVGAGAGAVLILRLQTGIDTIPDTAPTHQIEGKGHTTTLLHADVLHVVPISLQLFAPYSLRGLAMQHSACAV